MRRHAPPSSSIRSAKLREEFRKIANEEVLTAAVPRSSWKIAITERQRIPRALPWLHPRQYLILQEFLRMIFLAMERNPSMRGAHKILGWHKLAENNNFPGVSLKETNLNDLWKPTAASLPGYFPAIAACVRVIICKIISGRVEG